MADDTLTIIAHINAEAGREAALLAELRILVEETNREEGCLRYELNVAKGEPARFLMVEEWASYDLWQAHNDGAAIARFRGASAGLVAGVEVTQWLPDRPAA
ncbi:putative quinol monooxygenase [Prosthecomicrobium pneumaticum]|uniref:Quinol monooxygenase YgiN n=1 Tax=Prosthecomicrobium pneumaticum TaxID=81895 RepID=A0A7W9FPP2_9HYPH|nr:putative quinol monooxygenase [Prosthecomicrobium pneumaticum]MBB5754585.1 quinol monooxygenase YgiN [Prosthecomicrobium pneumaticum]